jgi:hypothetical protein
MNLDWQATVHWVDTISTTTVAGGRSRPFGSLRNAVKFVMEDLRDPYRSTAFIDTDGGGHYPIEAIESIYASEEYKAAPGGMIR